MITEARSQFSPENLSETRIVSGKELKNLKEISARVGSYIGSREDFVFVGSHRNNIYWKNISDDPIDGKTLTIETAQMLGINCELDGVVLKEDSVIFVHPDPGKTNVAGFQANRESDGFRYFSGPDSLFNNDILQARDLTLKNRRESPEFMKLDRRAELFDQLKYLISEVEDETGRIYAGYNSFTAYKEGIRGWSYLVTLTGDAKDSQNLSLFLRYGDKTGQIQYIEDDEVVINGADSESEPLFQGNIYADADELPGQQIINPLAISGMKKLLDELQKP